VTVSGLFWWAVLAVAIIAAWMELSPWIG